MNKATVFFQFCLCKWSTESCIGRHELYLLTATVSGDIVLLENKLESFHRYTFSYIFHFFNSFFHFHYSLLFFPFRIVINVAINYHSRVSDVGGARRRVQRNHDYALCGIFVSSEMFRIYINRIR